MTYTGKLSTRSEFFKKKEDTPRIDSTFSFLEPEKQNNLANSNGAHIEINLSKFPTIKTSQFNILNRSGMVGYKYIHDNISKSQDRKHFKEKEKINKTCRCEIFKLGDNMDLINNQNDEKRMYGSIGTLTTNHQQFDFMSQTLSEEHKEETENSRKKNKRKSNLKICNKNYTIDIKMFI